MHASRKHGVQIACPHSHYCFHWFANPLLPQVTSKQSKLSSLLIAIDNVEFFAFIFSFIVIVQTQQLSCVVGWATQEVNKCLANSIQRRWYLGMKEVEGCFSAQALCALALLKLPWGCFVLHILNSCVHLTAPTTLHGVYEAECTPQVLRTVSCVRVHSLLLLLLFYAS